VQQRLALFSLNTMSDYSDVVLIAKVNTLFRSSTVKDHQFYLKGETSIKEIESLKQSLREMEALNETTSTYTPLFWGAFKLFTKEGRLQGSVLNPMANISRSRSERSFLDDTEDQFKIRFPSPMFFVKPGGPFNYDLICDSLQNEASSKVNLLNFTLF
jgi:hypothetical protein